LLQVLVVGGKRELAMLCACGMIEAQLATQQFQLPLLTGFSEGESVAGVGLSQAQQRRQRSTMLAPAPLCFLFRQTLEDV
jgi:hypothetical protein